MNAQTKIEPPKSILGALAAALPELEGAKKNKANPAFKSKYADLGAVIEAIQPIASHGLWFRQVSHEREGGVCVETFYIHESGELSAGTFFVPADRNNAQGFGSANSYARRYGLQLAFGLATEDDDGNAASRAVAGQSQTGAVSQQQPKKAPAHSALKTAYRQFIHEANGVGDGDELSAFLATADSVKLVAEIREKLPHIWDGENWPEGQERPAEWETLSDFITRRQRECAEASAQYLTA